MNRQRILLQRAARGAVGVAKLADGWFVSTGVNGGWCDGPFSRRQAIQLAARWAMPHTELRVIITSD